jgi:ubiquinone/menaquinone biosynthesis C-methylase UbiE
MAAKMGLSYTLEARMERARARAVELDQLCGIRGMRVLEVGCGMGDLSRVLVQEYDCTLIAIDVMRHAEWVEHEGVPRLSFMLGDISQDMLGLSENSFDRIVSFVAWEHILHPWSALENCQRLLKPTGKKYMYAWLYGSTHASHLYSITDDAWPHLVFSPKEASERYKLNPLPWYYWCNRLSYQHYLHHFRKLGFFISKEIILKSDATLPQEPDVRKLLDLYPNWDLMTDAFKVVLEFDPERPKQSVVDPVYRLDR